MTTHPKNPLLHFCCCGDAVWHGRSVQSVPVTFPGCVPSPQLVNPWSTHWGSEWKPEESLMLCRHLSATAKSLVCYQHCFCY